MEFVSWNDYSQLIWKVIQNSMVPVTTNQSCSPWNLLINFCANLCSNVGRFQIWDWWPPINIPPRNVRVVSKQCIPHAMPILHPYDPQCSLYGNCHETGKNGTPGFNCGATKLALMRVLFLWVGSPERGNSGRSLMILILGLYNNSGYNTNNSGDNTNNSGYIIYIMVIWWDIWSYWLVVYLPLWKIWVRQVGWWHSQLNGKIIQMFQTTNQYLDGYRSRHIKT